MSSSTTAPTEFKPTGPVLISWESGPLMPGQPGHAVSVPVVAPSPGHLWILVPANSEPGAFLVVTPQETFLAKVPQAEKVITSPDQAQALVLRAEPVAEGEFKFKLVTTDARVLTLVPPAPGIVGIAGYVELKPAGIDRDPKQIWKVVPANLPLQTTQFDTLL